MGQVEPDQDDASIDSIMCTLERSSNVLHTANQQMFLTGSISQAMSSVYGYLKSNPEIPLATANVGGKFYLAHLMFLKSQKMREALRVTLNPISNLDAEYIYAKYLYKYPLFPQGEQISLIANRLTNPTLTLEEQTVFNTLKKIMSIKTEVERLEQVVINIRKAFYETPSMTKYFEPELKRATKILADAIANQTNRIFIERELERSLGKVRFDLMKAIATNQEAQIIEKYAKKIKYYRATSKVIKGGALFTLASVALFEVLGFDWKDHLRSLVEKDPSKMDAYQVRMDVEDNFNEYSMVTGPYINDFGCSKPTYLTR